MMKMEKSELRKEDCLLKAFDGKGDISNTNPDYRDLQIVFKVNEADIGKDKSKREIINTAEISDDTDKDGNPVDDKDSVPGNNKDGEDDIDREKVYVKYFDLSLQKDLVKAIIVEDGKTREVVATPNQLLKIEKKDDEYVYGKNDLFALIIIMKQMLLADDFKNMTHELDNVIETLNYNLHTITINKVLDRMGFPSNWQDLAKMERSKDFEK